MELYGILGERLLHEAYPDHEIHEGWEVILRNQFHDILPGSSIKEVYDDSKEEYEAILRAGREYTDGKLAGLAKCINAPAHSLVVYNPNSMSAEDVVSFWCPDEIRYPAVKAGEEILPVQKKADGTWMFTAKDVPSKGYRTFLLEEGEEKCEDHIQVSESHMENAFFSIDLNEKGQFISIYDKRAARELLPEGKAANVLMSYEDRPHNYDAWDLNNYYTEKSWEIDDVEEIRAEECGPVRGCLKITRNYLDSVISQYICIYRDTARIDIRNEIDWKEHQIFVKALFPVDIHTSEASFEIQYGNVKRPTHANTSWDFAKFEVCVHKWMDVSEDGYGVSVLNDCKYGCSVRDGVIGISMLKSAVYPNPEADKEHHTFTYSIFPHQGSWKEAGTVNQAYLLNNPLEAAVKENEGGTLPDAYSFVTCSQDNVVVEVVKKAEDEEAVIVRLYECFNRRTDVSLVFAEDIKSVCECDMLEADMDEWTPDGRKVSFRMKPFEIKTLKLRF